MLIQMADLRRLAIPVPPVDTQREIMKQIEKIKTLRQQIKKIEGGISELERDLPDLFFGDHNAPAKKIPERN